MQTTKPTDIDTRLILKIKDIPGEPPNKIAHEMEEFVGLRGWDGERAAIKAQHAADMFAQYVYSSRVGPAGALAPMALVKRLSEAGKLEAHIVKAFEVAHGIGKVAAEKAMKFGGEDTITAQEIREVTEALIDIGVWLTENAEELGRASDLTGTRVVPEIELTFEDIKGTIGVDIEAYGMNDATYIPSEDLVKSWFEWNPGIYTLLQVQETREAVGYINAMPVGEKTFKEILSGEFDESAFGRDQILRYEEPGYYYLYFCSVAIKKDWRNQGNFRKILDGFSANIGRLAHRNIFIREIVADAVSPEGRALCKSFGMKPVRSSDRGSSIYRMPLLPPDFKPVTKNAKRVHSFYYTLSQRLGLLKD